jgi:hypothetical protein
MRVYLPSTLPALAGMILAAEIGPSPVRGFAVTPTLREWYSSGDMEELEYVAMTHAARASLRMLHADPSAPRRRVVLAVELTDDQVIGVAGFDEPALIELKAPIPLSCLASGHIDDPMAADDIAAAVAALAAADSGDDDAQFAVDGAEGHELMWYATEELRRYGHAEPDTG